MKRIMQTICVQPDKFSDYCALHDCIWPEISDAIWQANIRNYSIFHSEGKLVQYFEYIGSSFAEDMQALSQSDAMQAWCAVCKTMQIPSTGQWTDMEEVFHLE